MRLSLTVVSEVLWPIEIGTPLVEVPIATPFDVFVQSIVTAVVPFTSKVGVSTCTSVVPFMSIVGAVMSRVVPALTSRCPLEVAIMFSPPAASWKESLLSPVKTSSSAD